MYNDIRNVLNQLVETTKTSWCKFSLFHACNNVLIYYVDIVNYNIFSTPYGSKDHCGVIA